MTFLIALWFSFIRFLGNLFFKSSSSSPLPVPVTARAATCRPLSLRSPDTTPTPSPTMPTTPPDRSPTTMSDGSLQVISLPPPDIGPLPSPWSPIGKKTPQDVWMSVDGMLTNATGPLDDDDSSSLDDSTRTAMLSLSRLSTVSLSSTTSALGAFGISVFVNLDQATLDTTDPTNVPKLNQTPPKRRETLTSITSSNTTMHSSRATKRFSTPLTKRDNADLRTASPISSLAYELRMGLFADGRSMSAFDNIIPLLDQASPESIPPPHNDAVHPVEVI